MLRTALRNVFAHKARLVMTALAITLGVAFVCGTLVFGDTVAQALRGASARSFKNVAVSVQAESRSNPGSGADGARSTALTSDLADKVRAVPGVTSVHPMIDGSATLAAKDGLTAERRQQLGEPGDQLLTGHAWHRPGQPFPRQRRARPHRRRRDGPGPAHRREGKLPHR